MTTFRLRGLSRTLGLNPRRRSAPDGGSGPPDTEAPSVPENLVATAVSSSQIDLTWGASTDNVAVTGYNIYRDDVLVDTSTANSYADTGLDPGTEYEYEVSAFDAAANESAPSDPDTATTADAGDTEAPSVPQNLVAAAVSDEQIDLIWDASTDNVAVTGYSIYRDDVLVDTSPTNSYADTGLDPGTEYEYEVSAFDAASNESARSAPDSATTDYVAAPADFNGSTHLTRGGALTDVSDSKVWSGSVWFRRDPANTFTKIFAGGSQRSDLVLFPNDVNGWVLLIGANASGAEILRLTIVSNDTDWHHLLWSFDLADNESRYAYFDDVEASVWTTYTDDIIDSTDTDFFVGSNVGGSNQFGGDMAEMWLRFGGSVIDFSLEANRRLFITADGKPANPTGWPSGGQVQLYGTVDAWHTNKGNGGGFSENGALIAGTEPVQLP